LKFDVTQSPAFESTISSCEVNSLIESLAPTIWRNAGLSIPLMDEIEKQFSPMSREKNYRNGASSIDLR
jgi:hypothetical protein